MSENNKQVVHLMLWRGLPQLRVTSISVFRDREGMGERHAHGNYDRSRERLNFEITKGGKIRPIDTSVSIPKRMVASLAERGIKDLNQGLRSLSTGRWWILS